MSDQAYNLRCLAKDQKLVSWKNRKALNLGPRLVDIVRQVWARKGMLNWRRRGDFNASRRELIAQTKEMDF